MYSSTPESRYGKNGYIAIRKGRISRTQIMNTPLNHRPISNNITTKYQTEQHLKPMMTQSKPPQSRARDNVKFENNDKKCDNFPRYIHQEQTRETRNNNGHYYTAQNKELYDNLANYDFTSFPESEIDSVYSSSCYHDDDNESSEMDSLYDQSEYTRRTLQKMETRVNTMTNRFVNRVKSQVEGTFSKLKLQSKLNNNSNNNTNVKSPKNEEGSGDGKKKSQKLTLEEDMMIKKMLKVKKDCYEKMETTLKILQKVDRLTEELYKNHMSNMT